MQWEGPYKRVSFFFYRVVIQAVLIFAADSWVLLDAIMRKVDSTHVGFLIQITGKRAIWQANGTWETTVDNKVIQTLGIQSEAI